jgi:hypothetical protein
VRVVFLSEVNYDRENIVRLMQPLDASVYRQLLLLGLLANRLLRDNKKAELEALRDQLQVVVGKVMVEADGGDWTVHLRKSMFREFMSMLKEEEVVTGEIHEKLWFAHLVEANAYIVNLWKWRDEKNLNMNGAAPGGSQMMIWMGLPFLLTDCVAVWDGETHLRELWEKRCTELGEMLVLVHDEICKNFGGGSQNAPAVASTKEPTLPNVSYGSMAILKSSGAKPLRCTDELKGDEFFACRNADMSSCATLRGSGNLWELSCKQGTVKLNGAMVGSAPVPLLDGDRIVVGFDTVWRFEHSASIFFHMVPVGLDEQRRCYAERFMRWVKIGDPVWGEFGGSLRKQLNARDLDQKLFTGLVKDACVRRKRFLGHFLKLLGSARQNSVFFSKHILKDKTKESIRTAEELYQHITEGTI